VVAVDRADYTNLGLIRCDTHQTFGHFSGTVVLDDGTQMTVENLMGFAEDVRTWW